MARKRKKPDRYLWWIALAVAIPIGGAAMMYMLGAILPDLRDNLGSQIAYSVILILLGLAVPYCMLKAVFSAAHEHDPSERSLRLKDIPKDKEQLVHGDRDTYA